MSRLARSLARALLRAAGARDATPVQFSRADILRAVGDRSAYVVEPFLAAASFEPGVIGGLTAAAVRRAVLAALRSPPAGDAELRLDAGFAVLRALQAQRSSAKLLLAGNQLTPRWRPDLQASSSATSSGIRCEVRSEYLPDRSDPGERQFVFGYRVRFVNGGDFPVQLAERDWLIETRHGDGRVTVQRVRGPGVIGQHPKLLQGESFVYDSFSVLQSPLGCMSGVFDFVDLLGTTTVSVACAPFALDAREAAAESESDEDGE